MGFNGSIVKPNAAGAFPYHTVNRIQYSHIVTRIVLHELKHEGTRFFIFMFFASGIQYISLLTSA